MVTAPARLAPGLNLPKHFTFGFRLASGGGTADRPRETLLCFRRAVAHALANALANAVARCIRFWNTVNNMPLSSIDARP